MDQGPRGRFKNTYEWIKFKSFNIWVRYFVWNFKGTLWNSTQNILLVHWYPLKFHTKYLTRRLKFYTTLKLWKLLDLRAHTRFLKGPQDIDREGLNEAEWHTRNSCHHRFWLVVYSALSHYLTKWLFIANWITGKYIRDSLNLKIVSKMVTIWFRTIIKSLRPTDAIHKRNISVNICLGNAILSGVM